MFPPPFHGTVALGLDFWCVKGRLQLLQEDSDNHPRMLSSIRTSFHEVTKEVFKEAGKKVRKEMGALIFV